MILKEYVLPNGATTYAHVIREIAITAPMTHARVQVSSYATEDAYLNGAGLMWNTPLVVPLTAVEGPFVASIENWMTADSESPFNGGVIAVDRSDTLDAAKARMWEAVKVTRSIKEVGNFIYEGGSYQADKERVTGAVQLAVLAKMHSWDYSETWTLTDNTTRTLDADQVIGLGVALGKFVSEIFSQGRELRERINAATSLEELQAIDWPA